jgi:alcohol dehydrogenase class IV
VADALAVGGIAVLARSLLRAVEAGDDLDARTDLLRASLLGGLAMQKGLGAIHALSHPLASLGVHHGTANAVLMPHVIRFNREVAPAVADRVATLLHVADPASGTNALARTAGLPTRLSDVGVHARDLAHLASRAADEPSCSTNPRALDVGAARAIYEAAL